MNEKTETPRKSVVWNELSSQDVALEDLQQSINFLEDRTSTVLGPCLSEDKEEDIPAPEVSALTARITINRARIQSINGRIKTLLDRLEL